MFPQKTNLNVNMIATETNKPEIYLQLMKILGNTRLTVNKDS